MRKILSFLALLVVGFALPQWAHAWQWNLGSNPEKVEVILHNNVGGTHDMGFKDGSWRYVFTSTNTTLEFNLAPYYDANGSASDIYGQKVEVSANGQYTGSIRNPSNKNMDKHFKVNNLTVGKTYRLEVTAADASSNNVDQFKFRAYEVNNLNWPDLYLRGDAAAGWEPGDCIGTYKFERIGNTNTYSKKFDNLVSGKDFKIADNNWGSFNFGLGNISQVLKSDTESFVLKKGEENNGQLGNTLKQVTLSFEVPDPEAPQNYLKVNVSYTPWNFDASSKPSNIQVLFNDGQTEYNNGEAQNMTFSSSNANYKWSKEFTPKQTYLNFQIKIWDGDKSITLGLNNPVSLNTWTSEANLAAGCCKYYVPSGTLTSGKKYRLEIKGDGDNKFQMRVVDTSGTITDADPVYLYYTDKTPSLVSTTPPSVSGNVQTITVTLTAGKAIVFGMANNYNAWDSGDKKLNGNRYSPSDEKDIPLAKSTFSMVKGDKGAWTVPTTGEYKFEVNTTDLTLKVTKMPDTPVATADKVYLYSTKGPSLISTDESSVSGNVQTVKVRLTEGTKFVLGTATDLGGDWNKLKGDKRYSPSTKNETELSNGTTYDMYNGDNGAWTVPTTGDYEFEINTTAKTLKVTKMPDTPVATADKVYLYSTNANGPKLINRQTSETTGDEQTITVRLTQGTKFVIGTAKDYDNWNSLNGNRYSPEGDNEANEIAIASGSTYNIEKCDNGAWVVSTTGIYTIKVNTVNNKLYVASIQPTPTPTLNLPLSKNDFAGGKKHYFLVGERMGEWHLQPEWELEVRGSEAVLENRYFYDGKFAIAVVSSYDNYANHTYTYYTYKNSSEFWFKYISENNKVLSCDNLLNRGEYYPHQYWDCNKPDNFFVSDFDGHGQNYWDGYGRFIDKVVVQLGENGNPTSIELQLPENEDVSNQERVFTLVGSDIYNQDYCNSSSDVHTPMWNEKSSTDDGWQEGWIQYDGNGKPYVDKRGEYLYLTAWGKDYMNDHPVRFNTTRPDGKPFPYSSSNITFEHWRSLKDLKDDAYADFYANGFTDDEGHGLKSISYLQNKLKNGKTFSFKVDPQNGEINNISHAWECYVIRDMWIGGEIKFWAGWGGNQRKTQDGQNTGATFHGPNGGPDINGSLSQDVEGFDITSGSTVKIYKNVNNRDNTNYRISTDGKPKYFNRVILWYNNSDKIQNSYIQFIQESGGPAILANEAENPTTKDMNYIDYQWYLNPAKDATGNNTGTDANLDVVAYQIKGYRVENKAPIFTHFPEINNPKADENGKVNISGMKGGANYKVADLQENNIPEFASFTDTGIIPGEGFSPGTYQYEIYVTYLDANGKEFTKLAWSNEVVIYSNQMVTPGVTPLQLVELRDNFVDASGNSTAVAGFLGISKTQKYLTYRKNSNADYYVMNIDSKEVTVTVDENGDPLAESKTVTVNYPTEFAKVNAQKARELLNEHPDGYYWTSDYYVRCLDYDAYAKTVDELITGKTILDESVPVPQLQLYQTIIKGEDKTSCLVGVPQRLTITLDNNKTATYYSAIVKRGGNLADATFKTQLGFTYTKADHTQATQYTYASTSIDPVMPNPFNPKYRYTYDHWTNNPLTDENNNFTHEWASITVPTGAKEGTQKVYVKLDENFNPRTFTLQFDFNRPNVNKEIYQLYDIQYSVNITNNASDVPLDIDAVLHDLDTNVDSFPNRYRIELKGLHPRNNVVPVIKFNKTRYSVHGKKDAEGNEIIKYDTVFHQPLKDQVANFGDTLNVTAYRRVQIDDSGTLDKVHLGVIKRGENNYDWMYKGHQDFNDPKEVLTNNNNYAYEDMDSEIGMTPLYYLMEFKNKRGDYACYDRLVPHKAGHAENATKDETTGLMMNDSDPLIGAYVAKGFSSDEAPEVSATAIYIYERPINPDVDNSAVANFNDLEVVSFNFNKSKANGPRKVFTSDNLPTNGQLSVNGYSELGDINTPPVTEKEILNLDASDDKTGYAGYVAVKAASYSTTPSGDFVTGVEDVLAGYDDAEAVYYNLQGIRVDNPDTPGVYVKVQGKSVTKVVVK